MNGTNSENYFWNRKSLQFDFSANFFTDKLIYESSPEKQPKNLTKSHQRFAEKDFGTSRKVASGLRLLVVVAGEGRDGGGVERNRKGHREQKGIFVWCGQKKVLTLNFCNMNQMFQKNQFNGPQSERP